MANNPGIQHPRVLDTLRQRFAFQLAMTVMRIMRGAEFNEQSNRLLQWVLDNAG